MTFIIGVISDTHGLLRPEAVRLLTGVDQILHAGDIGKADIIVALRGIAPVTAIRGNADKRDWAKAFPEIESVQVAGRTFRLVHDLKSLRIDRLAEGIDVVVYGHTHRPMIETIKGVLFLNPGSAGRRRFKLPITLATIEVTPDGLRPTIYDLA
jgi:putative phosphoesterase